jgi:hypothetical protein
MSDAPASLKRTGGCQCGAVRYVVTGSPTGVGICHCRMCQKAGGAPFMAFGGVKGSEFEVSRGVIATFRSSEIAERGFCAQCGTPLTYRVLGRDRVSFTLGSLDRPGEVAPADQLAIEARLPWFDALHALPGETMQEWLEKAKLAPIVSRQHPDHET